MRLRHWLGMVSLAAAIATTGCGIVADKDRIEIARVGADTITRGDFKLAIMKMPPEEKPEIRNRGDVRSALQDYIDTLLKDRLVQKLEGEGRLEIPEGLAEQIYFQKNPNLLPAQTAQQASELGLNDFDFQVVKEEIAKGIEAQRQAILRSSAVAQLVQDAIASDRYTISDKEWQREYEIRSESLFEPAEAHIQGILVRADDPATASDHAAAMRKRLSEGEDIEVIGQDAVAQRIGAPLDVDLKNDIADPAMVPFREFWSAAEVAKTGDVVGPIWVAASVRAAPDGSQRQIPPALLVCRITQFKPRRMYSLAEALDNEAARAYLARNIVYVKVLEDLRSEAGVEILEDNLPDPSIGGPVSGGPAGPIRSKDSGPALTE